MEKILSYGKIFGELQNFFAYPAERGVGNAQISGDVFQGRLLQHLGFFAEQLAVAVVGREGNHFKGSAFDLIEFFGHKKSPPFGIALDGMIQLLKRRIINIPRCAIGQRLNVFGGGQMFEKRKFLHDDFAIAKEVGSDVFSLKIIHIRSCHATLQNEIPPSGFVLTQDKIALFVMDFLMCFLDFPQIFRRNQGICVNF